MAIQRNAQSVDFGSAPQAGAAPDAVNYKAPDVAKYADANRSQAAQPSLMSDLLGAITPGLNKIASNEITGAREQAYLSGQAAAGAGKAQDSVDSNIFTKDWATAGYADTAGRIKQADAEAQTAVDMKTLREQSPEQFKDYLAQRRDQLMPAMAGMSAEAAKGFMAQQLTSDRAAIEKHAVEHQKFVIDQIGKSVQSTFSVLNDGMNQAKTDPVAYQAAVTNAYAGLYNNVVLNPNLPQDNKTKLITEAAQLALTGDNQGLYEQMRDQKLPGGGSMLDSMPFDDQVKLATAYKTSRTDTAAMRLGTQMTQLGLAKAQWSDQFAPAMSYKDFSAMKDQLVQTGAIKAGEIDGLTQAWAEGNQKKMANSKLADAYASGDVNTIFGLGKTEDEAASTYLQSMARKGLSAADGVGQLLQIGINTGQPSAFSAVGKMIRSSVATIGTTSQMDSGQAQMLNTLFKALDAPQLKGQTGPLSAVLNSLASDDDRAKIMNYRENIQKGMDPAVAATTAAQSAVASSSMTKEQRDVAAAQNNTASVKAAQAITTQGLWDQFKNAVVPNLFRSKTALDTAKATPDQGFFENDERAQQALASTRTAFLEESNYVSRAHPLDSDANRNALAMAAVAKRSVPMPDGNVLIMPRLPSGTDPQDFFGVDKSVGITTIGKAISDLHPAADGNRVVYKVNGQGQLQWQEYGKQGQLVNPGGTVDPKDIATAVQNRQDEETDKFHATNGAGVVAKGPDGSSVRFNGDNTVGVDNGTMLDFRRDLTKMESVRNTPYDDASGKVVNGKLVQTVGVGVSSHNPNFPKVGTDGKVSDADISNSFTLASNDAAKAGVRVQRETGLTNPNAFRLLSQLSYQGGEGFASQNKDYVEALRTRNTDAAVAALKSTTPYKMAHAERKAFYEDMTRKAISGG